MKVLARIIAAVAAIIAVVIVFLEAGLIAAELGFAEQRGTLSPVALGFELAGLDRLLVPAMVAQVLFWTTTLIASVGLWRLRTWGRNGLEACGWTAVGYLGVLIGVWMVGLIGMFRPMTGGDTAFATVGLVLILGAIVVVVLVGALGTIVAATFVLRARTLRAVMR